MTIFAVAGAGGYVEPGNRSDRDRFAALDETAQAAVMRWSAELYDGTRTVARCWRDALDAAEAAAALDEQVAR